MSRSYKKNYIDGHKDKFMKRQANKRARKSRSLADGGEYRKEFCSYDIQDWSYAEHDKSDFKLRKGKTRDFYKLVGK